VECLEILKLFDLNPLFLKVYHLLIRINNLKPDTCKADVYKQKFRKHIDSILEHMDKKYHGDFLKRALVREYYFQD